MLHAEGLESEWPTVRADSGSDIGTLVFLFSVALGAFEKVRGVPFIDWGNAVVS